MKQRRLKLSLQWLDIIKKVCISPESSSETEDGDLATEFLKFLQEQKKKQKYSLLSSVHLSLVLTHNCNRVCSCACHLAIGLGIVYISN